MATCQGCGAELPVETRRGPKRKWCSDRCRKRTANATHCVDCGAPCVPDRRRTSARCLACWQKYQVAAKREVAKARMREVLDLRLSGLNNLEAASRLGTSPAAVANLISRARLRYGWDVPRSPYYKKGEGPG
jgi:DNA-directed RNA polymerase specialized sigma24 family protein